MLVPHVFSMDFGPWFFKECILIVFSFVVFLHMVVLAALPCLFFGWLFSSREIGVVITGHLNIPDHTSGSTRGLEIKLRICKVFSPENT